MSARTRERLAARRAVIDRTANIAVLFTRYAVAKLECTWTNPDLRAAVEDALDAVLVPAPSAGLAEVGTGVLDVLAAAGEVHERPPLTQLQAATIGGMALRVSSRHDSAAVSW